MPTPLAAAKERIASTKKAQADATAAVDRTTTDCKTLKTTADKLAVDLAELTKKKDEADKASTGCEERLVELKKVKTFADVDVEIAALELELEQAKAIRAALPDDAAADIAVAEKAIEDATTKLADRKAELGYDALDAENKVAAAALKAAAEQAKADAEKAAKKAQLQVRLKQIQADIANRTKEKKDLFERVSTTNEALTDLVNLDKKITAEINAL